MKFLVIIFTALLFSFSASAQRGPGKKAPVPPHPTHRAPVGVHPKNTHGKTVSHVARTTRDGRVVSAVASSKSNGKKKGHYKRARIGKRHTIARRHTGVSRKR